MIYAYTRIGNAYLNASCGIVLSSNSNFTIIAGENYHTFVIMNLGKKSYGENGRVAALQRCYVLSRTVGYIKQYVLVQCLGVK